jgi:hypothetical protein
MQQPVRVADPGWSCRILTPEQAMALAQEPACLPGYQPEYDTGETDQHGEDCLVSPDRRLGSR